MPTDEKMRILEMIENGEISPEEGIAMIDALDAEAGDRPEVVAPPPDGDNAPNASASIEAEIARWKRWWQLPAGLGVALAMLSSMWLFNSLQSERGGGFYVALLLFLLSVGLVALAWHTRTSRWLHVRVRQPQGSSPRNIVFSMPLPVGLSAWFLRTFGHLIPSLDGTALDELILSLDDAMTDGPLFVHVNEGADGDQVQVYIG